MQLSHTVFREIPLGAAAESPSIDCAVFRDFHRDGYVARVFGVLYNTGIVGDQPGKQYVLVLTGQFHVHLVGTSLYQTPVVGSEVACTAVAVCTLCYPCTSQNKIFYNALRLYQQKECFGCVGSFDAVAVAVEGIAPAVNLGKVTAVGDVCCERGHSGIGIDPPVDLFRISGVYRRSKFIPAVHAVNEFRVIWFEADGRQGGDLSCRDVGVGDPVAQHCAFAVGQGDYEAVGIVARRNGHVEIHGFAFRQLNTLGRQRENDRSRAVYAL